MRQLSFMPAKMGCRCFLVMKCVQLTQKSCRALVICVIVPDFASRPKS